MRTHPPKPAQIPHSPRRFPKFTKRSAPAAAILLGLCLSGCETTQSGAPSQVQQSAAFTERSYQIPVAVPGLHGRFDRTRSSERQQVIVRPGTPATFRMQVDVLRSAAGAELRVFSGTQQLFVVPAVRMRPGDPAIPVVTGIPVDEVKQLSEVRLELHPAGSDAVFEVSAASVTIGEVAPETLRIE